MKRIVTLTAIAVSVVLSQASFAHGIKAVSSGSATGHAWAPWGGIVGTEQSVTTGSRATHFGVQSFTKAKSTSFAWSDGPVAVGGSASAGSGAFIGR